MLVLPFYIWYIIELLLRRITKSKHEAYVSLAFEKEAYQNQYDLNYLKRRKPFSWFKYLKIKSKI